MYSTPRKQRFYSVSPLPFISPKSEENATSDVTASSVPCNALNARGSSTDDDFDDGAGAGPGAFAAPVGIEDVAAARFRLAATEFDASFFPSVTLVGS